MRNFLRHTLFAWIWALVVFVIHAIPGKDLPHLDLWDRIGFDKLIHLVVFMLLSLFFCIGLRKQQQFSQASRNAMKIALIACILYGGLLEWMQDTLFVDRYADWVDLVANTIGAIFGVVIFRLIYGKELSTG